MAEKRSFSNKVTGSDEFAALTFEAQALYLQLCMAADDDGFVSAPKRVQRAIGASINALDELKDADYIAFNDGGGCMITHWYQDNDQDDVRREKNRERVRRFRARQKEEHAASEPPCNNDVTPCNVTVTLHSITPPSPSSLPLSSPSLPSPCTPIYYSPYNPPHISPTPISSSSLLYRARAQELAVRYWGRKLRKYEKSEIVELSEGLVRLRGPEAELSDGDVELLEIAFKASAKSGAENVAYIRGIYERWGARGIRTPDDYWAHEAERDIASGKVFRRPISAQA